MSEQRGTDPDQSRYGALANRYLGRISRALWPADIERPHQAATSPQATPPGAPSETTPQAPPDLSPRQRIVRRFEAWLNAVMAADPTLAGIPENFLHDAQRADAAGNGQDHQDPADLYSLLAAMTKLSGEVGLQGRAFRQLTDALTPVNEVPRRLADVESAQRAIAGHLIDLTQRVRSLATEETGPLPKAQAVLDVFFDLYDRLARGLRTCEAAGSIDADDDANDVAAELPTTEGEPLPWYRRMFGRRRPVTTPSPAPTDPSAPLAALRDGYAMTLSRLDAALHQWGIGRIGEVGDEFDPTCMTAMEVEDTDEDHDGVVLAVHRGGYQLHGRVLVAAQVKVGRARPAGNTQTDQEE